VTDFARLLALLKNSAVEFIVVGGYAATAHGSAHVTVHLSIVYRRTDESISRLVATLEPLKPYLRRAPPGLPFRLDKDTIRRGLNFTLTTAAGDLDLLGEVTGGGDYDALLPHTELRQVDDLECRFVNLQTLIHLKRAAGRPKDFERIAELEIIQEELRKQH